MAAQIKITINSTESGGGIEKTSKDLKGMGDAAEKSGGGFTVMKGLAVNALTAVAGAVLSAAGAVAGFMKDAIGAAGGFEAGMNTFKAAAGDMGQAEIEAFRSQFLDLGKELPVSTQAVQDAATAMVKGGIDPAIVRAGALKDTIQFGLVAGFETLEAAADTSAKLLGTWGDANATAAEQAAELAAMQEVLAKTASASTLEADKLSEAILMAGGSVKAAGGDYEEFVITLGATANAFPNAATQGTSFNNFVTRLIPQTNTAKDAMAELGLYTEETGSAFYDANGQFIGFEQTAELMQTAFAGLTEAQRSEAMATIFGNDAKNAAIALYEKGGEGISAFAAEVAAANGIQGQAASTQQGLNFAMDNFGGSVEALQIVIGSALLPVLTAFVTQASTALNAAIGVAEAIFDAGAGSTEFYEALGPLNAALGFAPGTLGAVYNAGVQVAGMLQTLGTQAIPIVQMAFTNLNAFIAAVMPSILGIVTSALTAMAAFWQTHGATIIAVAQSTWQMIVGVFQIAVGVIQGVFAIFAAALTGDYTTMGAQITQANELIWTGIRAFIEGFLGATLAIFGSSLSELIATWQYNLAMIPVVAKVAIDGAIAAFESALGLAPGIGKAIIDGIASGISSAAGNLARAAVAAAKAAFEAAKDFLDTGSPSKLFANEVGLPIAQGMALGIKAGAPQVASAGANLAGAAVQGATTNNYYQYSPTYSATPNNPSRDFAAMRSLAGAGV